MNVLVINASMRKQDSVSRALVSALCERFQANGAVYTERDLAAGLPFVSEAQFAAVSVAVAQRSSEQHLLAKLADILIAELQSADTLIIGAPMYNFGPPASLKAWADLVARAGTTFRYTDTGPQGLMLGKKAYVVAVSGGVPIGSAADFMSPWLRFFLGFIGIQDVEMIVADGVRGQDGEAKIQAAHERITVLPL